jgi:hypothetical protein
MATVGKGVGVNRGVGVNVGLGVGVIVLVGVMDGVALCAGTARVGLPMAVPVGEAVGVRVEVGDRLAVGGGEDEAVGGKVVLFELEVRAAGTVGNASGLGDGPSAWLSTPGDAPAMSVGAG